MSFAVVRAIVNAFPPPPLTNISVAVACSSEFFATCSIEPNLLREGCLLLVLPARLLASSSSDHRAPELGIFYSRNFEIHSSCCCCRRRHRFFSNLDWILFADKSTDQTSNCRQRRGRRRRSALFVSLTRTARRKIGKREADWYKWRGRLATGREEDSHSVQIKSK